MRYTVPCENVLYEIEYGLIVKYMYVGMEHGKHVWWVTRFNRGTRSDDLLGAGPGILLLWRWPQRLLKSGGTPTRCIHQANMGFLAIYHSPRAEGLQKRGWNLSGGWLS